MTSRQPLRCAAALAAATAMALFSAAAMASGNDGGGGAETGDTAAYNTGKSVYAGKFGCGACPLASKKLDASLARELVATKPGGVTLSAAESRALDVYLKRRFRL